LTLGIDEGDESVSLLVAVGIEERKEADQRAGRVEQRPERPDPSVAAFVR
jgi:hypothetical protein